jgi:hypothetical protein
MQYCVWLRDDNTTKSYLVEIAVLDLQEFRETIISESSLKPLICNSPLHY